MSVDHSTIHRWVLRYTPQLLEAFTARKKPVTGKWHLDETCIKVQGEWTYLYRAIDKTGATVDFLFSKTRNLKDAKRFFRRAYKRHGLPVQVTIDGSQTNLEAARTCHAEVRMRTRSGDEPLKVRGLRRDHSRLHRTRPNDPQREMSPANDTRNLSFAEQFHRLVA